MAKQFQVVGQNVAIKPIKQKTTDSGIILTGNVTGVNVGEVVSVGVPIIVDGEPLPIDVKVGDTVYYITSAAAQQFEHEGEKLTITSFVNVIGVKV